MFIEQLKKISKTPKNKVPNVYYEVFQERYQK